MMDFSLLAFPSLQHFIFQVVAMGLTAFALPRLTVTSIIGPVLMVVALGAINVLYWNQDLFGFIPTTFNLRIVGLFLTNGVLFWILVKVLPGIEISGIFPALAAPVIFSVLNILIERYAPLIPWAELYQNGLVLFAELRQSFAGLTPAPE